MSANPIHHFLYHGFDLESTENLMVLPERHELKDFVDLICSP